MDPGAVACSPQSSRTAGIVPTIDTAEDGLKSEIPGTLTMQVSGSVPGPAMRPHWAAAGRVPRRPTAQAARQPRRRGRGNPCPIGGPEGKNVVTVVRNPVRSWRVFLVFWCPLQCRIVRSCPRPNGDGAEEGVMADYIGIPKESIPPAPFAICTGATRVRSCPRGVSRADPPTPVAARHCASDETTAGQPGRQS
jgi:hypothetical protein